MVGACLCLSQSLRINGKTAQMLHSCGPSVLLQGFLDPFVSLSRLFKRLCAYGRGRLFKPLGLAVSPCNPRCELLHSWWDATFR